jgi:VanZ family protein
MSLRKWAATAFVVAAAAVLYLTLKPGPGGGPFQWSDKIQHFSAYLTLSLLAGLAAPAVRRAALYAVLLALAGYGLEWVQPLVGRSYDLGDALANALGCLAGFGLALLLTRSRHA